MKKLWFLIVSVMIVLPVASIQAQDTVTLQCGDLFEAELIPSGDAEVFDDYLLDVRAGTRIDLFVEPLGQNFNVSFIVRDSLRNGVGYYNVGGAGVAESISNFSLGGSDQIIGVYGVGPDSSREQTEHSIYNIANDRAGQYVGAYVISLGCTFRDGTTIPPGANATDETGSASVAPVPTPIFSGFGFPGLAPVDFTQGVTLDATLGTPSAGAINPGFVGIFGFAYDLEADQAVNLTFERTSGNGNLTLVVLSENNEVVFASALTTNNHVVTDFTVPTAGRYTVGIAETDLLPPASPESTAFNLTLE